MRVLFTTQPGTGHLHPLLPVAAGLRGRGHQVAFASTASFAAEIEAAGFDAFAVGRDWLTVDMVRAFPEMASRPPGRGRYTWARAAIFAGETAREALPDLVELGGTWRPDLVVREAAEFGGCVAAELLDVPHASVRTDSGSSAYGDRHLVAKPLDELREHWNLPSDPAAEMPFRYLQLSFAPAGLDEPDEEAALTRHRFRPVELRPLDPGDPPPWLSQLTGRPTVYATLGTVYNGPDLLAAIIDGLESEDLELVVTVGATQDPALFGRRPANVHIERWISQQLLVPHCDAVVTHGGYGTLSATLGAGVPIVCIPISADQPTNAERCAALGVGRIIDPDDRTPDAIRRATRAVLDDHRHRRAAERVAAESRSQPDLDHALDLLETLARDRVPLRAPRARAAVASSSITG